MTSPFATVQAAHHLILIYCQVGAHKGACNIADVSFKISVLPLYSYKPVLRVISH